jgi:hypothetical protein
VQTSTLKSLKVECITSTYYLTGSMRSLCTHSTLTVHSLQLAGNGLGSQGAEILAMGLTSVQQSLTELDISRNSIADEGALAGRAYMQHAACSMQHAAYSIHHTAYSMQHTAYSMQHAAYSMQHTAYSMQHTACSMQHTNAPPPLCCSGQGAPGKPAPAHCEPAGQSD